MEHQQNYGEMGINFNTLQFLDRQLLRSLKSNYSRTFSRGVFGIFRKIILKSFTLWADLAP